jgi:hypothetical protein|tara:strand:+ start:505 stop:957 length:453 start_codon:yes stop_codon:yes gene_type:complete
MALSREAIIAKLKLKNAKNSLASRKTNYKKAAIKADVTYEAYVKDKCDVTLAVFESVEYSLPKRSKSGSAPIKGTPEWALYKRIASRKTYTRQLIEVSCVIDEECNTMELFTAKYTDAKSVDEFLSDEYNGNHKGCYNVNAYPHLKELLS